MKNIVIAGNVGKDAETRTTQSGEKVTSWRVAVNERLGQEKRTIWFDCTLWGQRGESLAGYIKKGGKISVSGSLSTREYDGKTHLTIKADEVTFLSGSGGGSDQPQGRVDHNAIGSQRDSGYGAGGNAIGDEIPFAPEWR